MKDVVECLPNLEEEAETNSRVKAFAAYNEAIAVAVRRGAPLASYAIDRRCIGNYVEALQEDSVESLICFCCARRFPHLKLLCFLPGLNNERYIKKHTLESTFAT